MKPWQKLFIPKAQLESKEEANQSIANYEGPSGSSGAAGSEGNTEVTTDTPYTDARISVYRDAAFYKRNSQFRETEDPRYDLSPTRTLNDENAKDLIFKRSKELRKITKNDGKEHASLLGINEHGEYALSDINHGHATGSNPWKARLPEGYKIVGTIHSHPTNYYPEYEYRDESGKIQTIKSAFSEQDMALGFALDTLMIVVTEDGQVNTYTPPEDTSYSSNSPLRLPSYSSRGTLGILGNVAE